MAALTWSLPGLCPSRSERSLCSTPGSNRTRTSTPPHLPSVPFTCPLPSVPPLPFLPSPPLATPAQIANSLCGCPSHPTVPWLHPDYAPIVTQLHPGYIPVTPRLSPGYTHQSIPGGLRAEERASPGAALACEHTLEGEGGGQGEKVGGEVSIYKVVLLVMAVRYLDIVIRVIIPTPTTAVCLFQ